MAFMLRQICRSSLQKYCTIPGKYIHGTVKQYTDKAGKGNDETDAIAPNEKIDLSDPKLLISESCTKRLKEICQDGSFLRVTVEGGGCSGFQYKFDLDKTIKDDDITFGEERARVVIDSTSIEFCDGATVDYHIELIRSGFRILTNPKAEKGCSCGASFSLNLN